MFMTLMKKPSQSAFSNHSRTNTISGASINPLPNDEFLDVTKFKAFADNKLLVA